MCHFLFKIFLTLYITLLIPPVYATTSYYVSSSSGDDSWNGLYPSPQGDDNGPWKTIGKVNGFSLTAGDTVLILAGNYAESLRPSTSGTSNAYITFKKYENDEVVISGENISPAIELSDRSYIIIDGLKATNVRRYIRAVNTEHTIIRNCRFESPAPNASYTVILYSEEADFNSFINNYASGGYDLINFRQNSSHNLMAGNEMHSADHAIFAIRTGSYNIIRNNYFHNDKNKIGEIYNYCDGFDITGEQGDVIQLAGQNQTARITDVDYTNNSITIDNALTWSANQGISLAYSDSAPDIGAFEYDGVDIIVDYPINLYTIKNSFYIRLQNGQVVISFTLPNASPIQISIYDIRGKCISTIENQSLPGRNKIIWNRHSHYGKQVSGGYYMVKFQYGKNMFSKRFVICR